MIGFKLSAVLFVASVSLILVAGSVHNKSLLGEFGALHKREQEDDFARARDAVAAEVRTLGDTASDWAFWDDSYGYMTRGDKKFAETNLQPTIFDSTPLDYICFLTADGKVKYSLAKLPSGKVVATVKGFDPATFDLRHAFAGKTSGNDLLKKSGIAMMDGVPGVVFSRPVLPNKRAGPAAGTLIFARFLTPSHVQAMSERVKVPFTLDPLGSAPASKPKWALSERQYDDIDGHPAFKLRAWTPPDILDKGHVAASRLLTGLLLLAVAVSILTVTFVGLLVSKPLASLTDWTRNASLKLSEEAPAGLLKRRDEIGVLSKSFDDMVKRLESAQRELVNTSRQAGMSDVARGILHNAGNILTSVTVSVYKLRQHLATPKFEGIEKAADLIDDCRSGRCDLEKLSKLSPYLRELAAHLREDASIQSAEIESLGRSVDSLGHIVDSQRLFSEAPNLLSEVSINALVSDALQVLGPAFERHSIDVDHVPGADCIVLSDGHRVSQMLSNLLINAKDAVKFNEIGDRKVSVHVASSDAGVDVMVVDNGVGISEESMAKIFQSGYSTKATGGGYGLHFCANAAKELGLEIRAESDGAGRGATFALHVPSACLVKQSPRPEGRAA